MLMFRQMYCQWSPLPGPALVKRSGRPGCSDSETTHLSPDWPFAPAELNKIQGVTFRIRLEEKTGRFERSSPVAVTFFSI